MIRAPGRKQSPPLCFVPPQAGGAVQRDPGRHRPGRQIGSVAVIFPLHAATSTFRPTLSCLPHSSWREDASTGGRCRTEQRAAHTDAAGQGHLLLLHILAQAPALSGGYMVRRFPDPNSECQAQETGNVAPCGLLQKTHIIYDGAKAKT